MTNRLLYCFKNDVRHFTDEITVQSQTKGVELETHASYCMKLCMLCNQRLICVVNRELIVAKDHEEFKTKVGDMLETLKEEA